MLDRAADAAAARAAEAAAGGGDEAEAWCAARGRRDRRARTPAARARPRRRSPGPRRRRARRPCRPRSPRRRGRRRRRRRGRARPRRRRAATATSSPRSTCALVSTRPVGDHDARPAAPAAAEPDHRRPDALGRRGHRRLQLSRRSIARRPSGSPLPAPIALQGRTCRLQVCLPAQPSAGSKSSDLHLQATHYQYALTPWDTALHAPASRRWPTRSRASATAGRCSSSPRCSTARSASTSSRTELDGIAPNVLSGAAEAARRAGARGRRARTPSARRGSSTSSRRAGASWPARCGCWPTGAPARRATASRCATRACGAALEARWWCPDCEQVVDDAGEGDVVHV